MISIKKLNLGQFPTPMYRLDNMSRTLGRSIYIKRDDMTGVSTGGNKVRKLEYLLYDAKEKGAVLLPAPLAPISETISPWPTSKLTPFTACILP